MTIAQRARTPEVKRRRDENHVRSLKECLLFEIARAIEQCGLTDEAAAEVTGERIETLENALRGRYAAYGIVRLMRTLASLGVPVSISVTRASTIIRAGERRKVIGYRRGN